MLRRSCRVGPMAMTCETLVKSCRGLPGGRHDRRRHPDYCWTGRRHRHGTPLPAGNYIVSIEMLGTPPRQLPTEPFDVDDLPVHDLGPWPEGLSLRREDLYGDDGR